MLNQSPRHEFILQSGTVSADIINLSTTWRWAVSFTFRSLLSKSIIAVLVGQEAMPTIKLWKSENHWFLPGIELCIRRFSARGQVTTRTQLSWFHVVIQFSSVQFLC